MSDGIAVHILMAAADALGHRTEELALNCSTIHRHCQENRKKASENIQTEFIDSII